MYLYTVGLNLGLYKQSCCLHHQSYVIDVQPHSQLGTRLSTVRLINKNNIDPLYYCESESVLFALISFLQEYALLVYYIYIFTLIFHMYLQMKSA